MEDFADDGEISWGYLVRAWKLLQHFAYLLIGVLNSFHDVEESCSSEGLMRSQKLELLIFRHLILIPLSF